MKFAKNLDKKTAEEESEEDDGKKIKTNVCLKSQIVLFY
jgi:hypothetical protein